MALANHPDKFRDDEEKKVSEQRMQDINAAYAALKGMSFSFSFFQFFHVQCFQLSMFSFISFTFFILSRFLDPASRRKYDLSLERGPEGLEAFESEEYEDDTYMTDMFGEYSLFLSSFPPLYLMLFSSGVFC